MYGLEIFDKNYIAIFWRDIYYGIKNNYLVLNSASEYAMRQLENNQEDILELTELVWNNTDKSQILQLLEKIVGNKVLSDDVEKINTKKLRFCILMELINTIGNIESLFEKVERVYSDFDYPEDMEEFISYMPIRDGYDPSIHSKEENQNRLLLKLKSFLEEEKDSIN